MGQIKIGGQPGELPTVLIGSIFYQGHKIVKDSQKGVFDKAAAERLIKNQEELCDATGNPGLLDVVISSVEAVEKFVDFISTVTKTPFLFDAWPLSVRLDGLKYLEETGQLDNAVYNSISPITKDAELNAIKESGVKAAIVLAFNFKNPWSEGLLSTLRGTPAKKSLLSMAAEAGIAIPLVDCSVTSVPSIGIAARTIRSVKAEFGLPSGCGAANASTRWREAKRKWGSDTYKACEASLQTLTLAMCADFLMYGPIESANWIIPASAAVDATVAAAAKELGTTPATREHPLYKLFPDVSAIIQKRDG
jgi:tetrahydromethanopterin S-methyltransferase subunit H